MIDEFIDETKEKGFCIIKNNSDPKDQYMLVRLSEDNKRAVMLGNIIMINLKKDWD